MRPKLCSRARHFLGSNIEDSIWTIREIISKIHQTPHHTRFQYTFSTNHCWEILVLLHSSTQIVSLSIFWSSKFQFIPIFKCVLKPANMVSQIEDAKFDDSSSSNFVECTCVYIHLWTLFLMYNNQLAFSAMLLHELHWHIFISLISYECNCMHCFRLFWHANKQRFSGFFGSPDVHTMWQQFVIVQKPGLSNRTEKVWVLSRKSGPTGWTHSGSFAA